MNKLVALICIIVLTALGLGCSSGGNSLVLPSEEKTAEASVAHFNWGMWQFTADPVAGTLDIAPLRGVDMHVNVLPFLEPPPFTNLTLESVQFNGNLIDAEIGLRHPFLGLSEFTGFDVCGILITNGSVVGFSDASLRMAGPGDTRLLNPDGYTRWWNPAEFPVNQGTMFSYNDGLLGAPDSFANYNSTMNGYKYYADGLTSEQDINTLDPAQRGVFSAGNKNVRMFHIELGAAGLVFNYAVDACWAPPKGSGPWSVDDFGPEANKPEAWNINLTETSNTLYNDGSTSGGGLSIDIDVYDHFNAGLNNVVVESPGNFTAASSATPVGSGNGYSTYEIEIASATPAAGSINLLISVKSDAIGYGGLLPGKTVTSYFTHTVDVSAISPITGVFVDGDNASDPLENGTMSHPYNTVQEGINAAGVGVYAGVWDVYVDLYSGGNYALFTLKSGVNCEGWAWNGGSGRPEIILTASQNFADTVTGASMKNFLVTFNHTTVVGTEISLFVASNSPNLTIQDCKFMGIMKAQYSNFFKFQNCDGFLLEHNEFVNFRNKANYPGFNITYFMRIQGCDNSMIRHNEYHDIGFDDEGPNLTNNADYTDIWFPGPDGSDTCDNLEFRNNLIYDIKDYSHSTSAGYAFNYITIMELPSQSNAGTGMVVANNTVDDISDVALGGSEVGAMKFCYGYSIGADSVFKNTILSNWNPFSGAENGHRGFWADGFNHVNVDYSNVYNIGPVGNPQVRDYVNTMHKGTGSFGFDTPPQDPAYDMTPGANFYHVTNSTLLSDDGTEMGAFGGPDGDWVAPSQL